jgi:hypothetical protein
MMMMMAAITIRLVWDGRPLFSRHSGTFDEVSLNGENGTIGWYGLSQLIHTNLRKRKVLACLGLATHYHHESPRSRRYSRTSDVNRNENICFLVGNHATENFEQWSRLSFREHVPQSIQLQFQQTRPVQYKSPNGDLIRSEEPVRWTNSELQLLAEAGKHSIGCVGKLVRKAINTIASEVPSLPPVASSGILKGLDPKLCVRGMDSHLSLPLSHEILNKVIKTDCCKQSSFGQSGSRHVDESIRKCWTIDLHSDVQVTDLAFQQYLQASHLATVTEDKRSSGVDAPGLWTSIHERFLPLLHGLRRDNQQRGAESAYSVVAKPNKMLIYEKGGKFKAHRDGQHGPGHFGTLVILLPVSTESSSSDDIGGDLVLCCMCQDAKVSGIGGSTVSTTESGFMMESHKPPTNGASATWHIFMLGTCHEVRPAQSAYRVALTYQLWFEGGTTPVPRAPRPDLLSLLGHSIQHWVKCNNMEELVEFVLPLRHCYPIEYHDCDLAFTFEGLQHRFTEPELRGQDSWLFRGLSDAFKGTEMKLSLEYNEVDIGVAGYSQGVVVGRGYCLQALLKEEQSKIIWLHHEEGDKLVDSSWPSWRGRRDHQEGKNTIVVACISFHHERFRSRYGRCYGFGGSMEEWVHPDDEVLED